MLADMYGQFEFIRFTGPLPVITGLFAIGHIGYICGMLRAAQQLNLFAHHYWKTVLSIMAAVYCLAGIFFWFVLVKPSNHIPGMHMPLAVYTLFLAFCAAIMGTVSVLEKRFLAMGIGGLVFLVSDIFLAVKLFQDNWNSIGDFCWITYGISQMLIVYGALIASRKT